MQARYEIFRAGSMTSWESFCDKVAEFLTQIGRDRVISVSQSEDDNSAVFVVWYWE